MELETTSGVPYFFGNSVPHSPANYCVSEVHFSITPAPNLTAAATARLGKMLSPQVYAGNIVPPLTLALPQTLMKGGLHIPINLANFFAIVAKIAVANYLHYDALNYAFV